MSKILMDTPTAAKERLSKLTVDQLKEMATLLMTDYRDGAADVFDWVLEEMEQRLPGRDFSDFCDTL